MKARRAGWVQGSTTDIGGNEHPASLPPVDLGTGRTAKAVALGLGHTCVILDNDSVKCWGDNGVGQLGYGDTTVRGDGPGEMGDNLPAVNLGTGRTAVSISAGDSHTCVILDNFRAKCWGFGSQGRLGYGDLTNRGDGPGEMGDALPELVLDISGPLDAISAGQVHTCAIVNSKGVKCWGGNAHGQLGYGDTTMRSNAAAVPYIDLGGYSDISSVSAANTHTCAVIQPIESVKCWGNGASGKLGYGDTTTRGDGPGEMGAALPVVDVPSDLGNPTRGVSAGLNHTCALRGNGRMKCWGSGADGRLGYGDTTTRGDGPGEMGTALPSVDPGGFAVAALAVTTGNASSHTCALIGNQTVRCWGAGGSGRLGYSSSASIGDNETPASVGPVILDNNNFAFPTVLAGASGNRVDTVTIATSPEPGEQTNTTRSAPVTSLWYSWTAPSSGLARFDTCGSALDTTLGVYTGTAVNALTKVVSNDDGCQTAGGSSVKFAAARGVTYRISIDGRASATGSLKLAWRASDYSVRVATGDLHTCAINDDDSLHCWGSGLDGRLGYGNTTTIGDNEHPAGSVDLGTGRTAKAVTTGGIHTCAILDTDALKCWGNGALGRIGSGDTVTRGDGRRDGRQLAGGQPRHRTHRQPPSPPAELPHLRPPRQRQRQVLGRQRHRRQLGLGDSDRPWRQRRRDGRQLAGGRPRHRAHGDGDRHGRQPHVRVLDNGTVKCWGRTARAQLGLRRYVRSGRRGRRDGRRAARRRTRYRTHREGDQRRRQPHLRDPRQRLGQVLGHQRRPGGSGRVTRSTRRRGGEMGDALPAVDLGTGRTAKAIAAGDTYTCAILDNDTVKCWGDATVRTARLRQRDRPRRQPGRDGRQLALRGSRRRAEGHRHRDRGRSHLRLPRQRQGEVLGQGQLRRHRVCDHGDHRRQRNARERRERDARPRQLRRGSVDHRRGGILQLVQRQCVVRDR